MFVIEVIDTWFLNISSATALGGMIPFSVNTNVTNAGDTNSTVGTKSSAGCRKSFVLSGKTCENLNVSQSTWHGTFIDAAMVAI